MIDSIIRNLTNITYINYYINLRNIIHKKIREVLKLILVILY